MSRLPPRLRYLGLPGCIYGQGAQLGTRGLLQTQSSPSPRKSSSGTPTRQGKSPEPKCWRKRNKGALRKQLAGPWDKGAGLGWLLWATALEFSPPVAGGLEPPHSLVGSGHMHCTSTCCQSQEKTGCLLLLEHSKEDPQAHVPLSGSCGLPWPSTIPNTEDPMWRAEWQQLLRGSGAAFPSPEGHTAK
jgi:hypothetical protein